MDSPGGIQSLSAKEGGIEGLSRNLGQTPPGLGKNHRLGVRRNRPPRRAPGFAQEWGWPCPHGQLTFARTLW